MDVVAIINKECIRSIERKVYDSIALILALIAKMISLAR